MHRLHIGLTAKAPMDAITLAGHSFQKESWIYDDNGNHSTRPGLKVSFDTEEDRKAFEDKLRAEVKHHYFRVQEGRSGLRCDLVDARIPGERIRSGRDWPVSDYVYLRAVLETEDQEPATLTSPEVARELAKAGAMAPKRRGFKGEPVGATEAD